MRVCKRNFVLDKAEKCATANLQSRALFLHSRDEINAHNFVLYRISLSQEPENKPIKCLNVSLFTKNHKISHFSPQLPTQHLDSKDELRIQSPIVATNLKKDKSIPSVNPQIILTK